MPSFKDEEGREWRVRVDVGTVQRVRDLNTEPTVDLGSLKDAGDNMVRLGEDPVLLCNVLYLICERQAKERGVSETDFGELFMGDVLFEAAMALEEAISDFFPPAKRSLLQRLRNKVSKVREAGEGMIEAKLEDKELETKILATMKANLETTINESLTPLRKPTNSPE